MFVYSLLSSIITPTIAKERFKAVELGGMKNCRFRNGSQIIYDKVIDLFTRLYLPAL